MVKDIVPGPRGSNPSFLRGVGGTVFFDADDVKHGNELWKSDGTKAGTVLVKDIWPGKRSSRPVWHLFIGRIFYFRGNDGAHGVEPWSSDGTKAGTTLVADIYPGTRGSFPKFFANLRGTAFVGARSPSTGRELWRGP
jgi:ELWxxDGT repeat protein